MSRRDGPPVCKFFVQGRCLAGDRCRYAHPATSASRVEQNQHGGRNAVQQGGARRLLVPPPSSTAAGQQNVSASSSSAAKQRLGSIGPGAADSAEASEAAAKAGTRPAWGGGISAAAKPPSQAQQQSEKQKALAYDAADFVPASAAWQAHSRTWGAGEAAEQYAEQHEDWPEEWLEPQHSGFSQEQQQACYVGLEQEYYESAEGGEQHGEWDTQHGQQGQWSEEAGAEGQWQGDSSPDAAALERQFSGLQVDEQSGSEPQHGDWLLMCEICGKFVLEPEDDEQCAEHIKQCSARHERVAARHASANIECGICLERVMGKVPASARKFGLLACEHPFCLACIRSWRGTGDNDATTDTARTCPLCRTRSHFVTPSAVWPTSEQQKEDIIGGYKRHLASIDCRNFAFGEGSCPFGTSCFYRHAYPDGTLWQPSLRKVGDAEGGVRIVAQVRLSSFLESSPALRQ